MVGKSAMSPSFIDFFLPSYRNLPFSSGTSQRSQRSKEYGGSIMQLLKALLQKDPNKRPSSTTCKLRGNGWISDTVGALESETAIARTLSMFFINLVLPSWGFSIVSFFNQREACRFTCHIYFQISSAPHRPSSSHPPSPSFRHCPNTSPHPPIPIFSILFPSQYDDVHDVHDVLPAQVPRRVSSPSGPWPSRTCATAPPPRRPTRPWRTAPSALPRGCPRPRGGSPRW